MLDQREGPPPPSLPPKQPHNEIAGAQFAGLAVQLIAAAGSTVGFLVEEGAGRD